ncbi:hypothetical protein FS749_014462 [Ceratobasidium sp. UAMH 11750]|nr:hypothetical protein FS749_014462 [Ceratobasidium sp. UAMH 11750]
MHFTWCCGQRVCGHWRSVAINNPTLWTYIYISRPAPHNSATVYLARSGSTTLLNLDLDMTEGFFDYFGLSVKDTINFLVQKGASINRWESLMVRGEIPQVLYKILEYISPESAPSLRFLSLRWKTRSGPQTIEDEAQSLEYLDVFDQASSGSSDRFPQLRTVQFRAVPADFLFRRPLPMFVGLVHLKLTLATKLFPLPKLHTLLSANLQLESLHLGVSFCADRPGPANCRVTLLSLRSLMLAWQAWDEGSLSWALETIEMINGPAVEHLELSSPGSSNEELLRLVEQIAPNVFENGNIHASGGQTTSHQSIYPNLQSINIAKLEPADDCAETFQALLSALPTVTSLAAPHSALDLLGKMPWLLPRLERIRFFGRPPEALGSILSRRTNDGSALKTLEAQDTYLEAVRGCGIKSLDIVKLPATVVAEYYESDDDDDDEEDYDDDDDGTDLDDFDEDDFGEDYDDDAVLHNIWGEDVDGYEAAMESAWQRFQAELDGEDDDDDWGDEDEGEHSGEDDGYDDDGEY